MAGEQQQGQEAQGQQEQQQRHRASSSSTIQLGQSPDDVRACSVSHRKLPKQIYIYKDMKITWRRQSQRRAVKLGTRPRCNGAF
jgi:hypothetical protein